MSQIYLGLSDYLYRKYLMPLAIRPITVKEWGYGSYPLLSYFPRSVCLKWLDHILVVYWVAENLFFFT